MAREAEPRGPSATVSERPTMVAAQPEQRPTVVAAPPSEAVRECAGAADLERAARDLAERLTGIRSDGHYFIGVGPEVVPSPLPAGFTWPAPPPARAFPQAASERLLAFAAAIRAAALADAHALLAPRASEPPPTIDIDALERDSADLARILAAVRRLFPADVELGARPVDVALELLAHHRRLLDERRSATQLTARRTTP